MEVHAQGPTPLLSAGASPLLILASSGKQVGTDYCIYSLDKKCSSSGTWPDAGTCTTPGLTPIAQLFASACLGAALLLAAEDDASEKALATSSSASSIKQQLGQEPAERSLRWKPLCARSSRL